MFFKPSGATTTLKNSTNVLLTKFWGMCLHQPSSNRSSFLVELLDSWTVLSCRFNPTHQIQIRGLGRPLQRWNLTVSEELSDHLTSMSRSIVLLQNPLTICKITSTKLLRTPQYISPLTLCWKTWREDLPSNQMTPQTWIDSSPAWQLYLIRSSRYLSPGCLQTDTNSTMILDKPEPKPIRPDVSLKPLRPPEDMVLSLYTLLPSWLETKMVSLDNDRDAGFFLSSESQSSGWQLLSKMIWGHCVGKAVLFTEHFIPWFCLASLTSKRLLQRVFLVLLPLLFPLLTFPCCRRFSP